MVLFGLPGLRFGLVFRSGSFLATGRAPYTDDFLGRLWLVGSFSLCVVLGLLLCLPQAVGHLLGEKGIVLVYIPIGVDIVVGHRFLACLTAGPASTAAHVVVLLHGAHGLGVEVLERLVGSARMADLGEEEERDDTGQDQVSDDTDTALGRHGDGVCGNEFAD